MLPTWVLVISLNTGYYGSGVTSVAGYLSLDDCNRAAIKVQLEAKIAFSFSLKTATAFCTFGPLQPR